LLKINERGKWTDPPPPEGPKREKQDEEIFQTARLIKWVDIFTCAFGLVLSFHSSSGHFMGMIIGDYAAAFLGLAEGQFWDIPAFDVSISLPPGSHDCFIEHLLI
jgi:hypothetical protein